jgi:hypothetical protein
MINEYQEVCDHIRQNSLENNILKVKNCNPIHEVKLSFIKKVDNNKTKDFSFEFEETKNYFVFITIVDNPNFCKPFDRKNVNVLTGSVQNLKNSTNLKNSEIGGKNQNQSYFNFDYNKHNIDLNIARRESPESEIEIIYKCPLNREQTSISHATKDSLEYFLETKNLTTTANSTIDVYQFPNMLERYYMIEVENRKPVSETLIKEDGVISVTYILVKEKKELIELYTMIKYSIFYVKEILINYL